MGRSLVAPSSWKRRWDGCVIHACAVIVKGRCGDADTGAEGALGCRHRREAGDRTTNSAAEAEIDGEEDAVADPDGDAPLLV